MGDTDEDSPTTAFCIFLSAVLTLRLLRSGVSIPTTLVSHDEEADSTLLVSTTVSSATNVDVRVFFRGRVRVSLT